MIDKIYLLTFRYILSKIINGDDMIIDITGIELTPGNDGKDCLGNGEHFDKQGNLIECCCDECDYLLCCASDNTNCIECNDFSCPRNKTPNVALRSK